MEICIHLFPYSFEPLTKSYEVGKHFLGYLVRTCVLADIYHSPQQISVGLFELFPQIGGIWLDLVGYHNQRFLQLACHGGHLVASSLHDSIEKLVNFDYEVVGHQPISLL